MMWRFEDYYDNIAFITDDGITISYSGLQNICSELKVIINKKSFIFHVSSNTPGSVLGYVAFLQTGNPSLILETVSFLQNQNEFIESWNPDYIWMETGLIENDKWNPVFSCFNYTLYQTQNDNTISVHNDLALVLTTSGSTGNVKFVRQSFMNIRTNTNAILSFLPIEQTDRSITLLPMHYTFGLSVINTHLSVGGSLIITDKSIIEKSCWDLIKSYKITNIQGVPFHFTALKQLKIHQVELPSLKFFAQAGGHLPEDIQLYFAGIFDEKKIPLYIMYGQTEATARISYLSPLKLKSRPGSVGKAIPGVKIKLFNEKGEQINEASIQGEIHIEGRNIAMGYARKRMDLSKGKDFGKRLNTGDTGFFDDEGFLYITGRKNREIKLQGRRINLDELEDMILKIIPDGACACKAENNDVIINYSAEISGIKLLELVCEKTGISPANIILRKVDASVIKLSEKRVRCHDES